MHRPFVTIGLLFGTLHDGFVAQSFPIVQGFTSLCRCNCSRVSRRELPSSCAIFCRGMRVRGGGSVNDADKRFSRKSSSVLKVSKSPDASTNHNIEKYHLIWSPNFWKKLVVSLLFWVVLGSTPIGKTLFKESHSATCHQDELLKVSPVGVILPLLSSSCCAIQLVINALSGLGCAGFNTYLGPVRPLFLSLFLVLTQIQLKRRHLVWTLASLVLAFLPEGVYLWNKSTTQNINQSTNEVLPVNAKITLNIPTMGCIACVNKVDSSIRNCALSKSIRQEKSWLKKDEKGGLAELLVAAENSEDVDKIAAEVVSAVGNAGFKCEIDNIEMNAL